MSDPVLLVYHIGALFSTGKCSVNTIIFRGVPMGQLEKVLKEIDKQFAGEADNVKDFIAERLESYASSIEFAIDDCGSPIEKLFSIAIEEAMKKAMSWDALLRDFDVFEIQRQARINYGSEGRYYKADFLISLADQRYGEFLYIIECDGHEFHEKTKAQVRADKKRERDFLEQGYVFMRFTGSEIHENPYGCARSSLDTIRGHVTKVLNTMESVRRMNERKDSESNG